MPCRTYQGISIHALREEGDQDFLVGMGDTLKFQSTPSARRATQAVCILQQRAEISIHALREEGDILLQ